MTGYTQSDDLDKKDNPLTSRNVCAGAFKNMQSATAP